MMSENGNNSSAPLRLYVTGTCEGLTEIVEALRVHGGIELVGLTEEVRGGSVGADRRSPRRRAPRHPRLRVPARRLLGDPRAHAGPGDPALLRRVLRHPRRGAGASRSPTWSRFRSSTENIVFAIRKACQAERRSASGASRVGKVATVFSPKGGTGKTVRRPRTSRATFAKYHKATNAAARPRPPVRRRRDHARPRAREDDLRPGRRPGRARHREAGRLHDQASVRARRPPGAAPPGGRRARHRGASWPGCSRSPARPTT